MPLRREYPSLPLVGAGAVVHVGSDVLLIRRRFPPNQGLWAIPGGLVELGERTEEAAIREVAEETGLEIEIEGLLDVATDIHRDSAGKVQFHYILVDYSARPIRGKVTPNEESTDWRWFSKTDVELAPMSRITRVALRRFFQAFSVSSGRRQGTRVSRP